MFLDVLFFTYYYQIYKENAVACARFQFFQIRISNSNRKWSGKGARGTAIGLIVRVRFALLLLRLHSQFLRDKKSSNLNFFDF
jgi:hypothetical protein